jgi:MerR family copper efflux transcriptional regulator
MQTMTIGRLAKEAGVKVDTIRYYERHGLLPRASRRASGYREYARADVAQHRLVDVEQRIRELQKVRRGLKALIEACPGHGELATCPIVAALSTSR